MSNPLNHDGVEEASHTSASAEDNEAAKTIQSVMRRKQARAVSDWEEFLKHAAAHGIPGHEHALADDSLEGRVEAEVEWLESKWRQLAVPKLVADTLCALGAISLYCLLAVLVFKDREGWTTTETCYFAIATLSTVGVSGGSASLAGRRAQLGHTTLKRRRCGLPRYALPSRLSYELTRRRSPPCPAWPLPHAPPRAQYGDYSPSSNATRAATVLIIFLGIIGVMPHTSRAVANITGPITATGRSVLNICFPPEMVDLDGDGDADVEVPAHALPFYTKVGGWWVKEDDGFVTRSAQHESFNESTVILPTYHLLRDVSYVPTNEPVIPATSLNLSPPPHPPTDP